MRRWGESFKKIAVEVQASAEILTKFPKLDNNWNADGADRTDLHGFFKSLRRKKSVQIRPICPIRVPVIIQSDPKSMLEVKNLTVRYGDFEAVKNISFEIKSGEIVGLLGPNGAGKSSTVKAIVGIRPPESGQIRIGGHDMAADSMEALRRLGYVPDNAAAYNLLTGREFLELVASLYDLDDSTAKTKIEGLLRGFSLDEIASRMVSTYSKGQRQKLVIASALLHDPDLLVMDEPLNGLDVNAVRLVREVIERMAGQGKAVLFCSHTLEVVQRLCSRVIIVHRGEVLRDEPTASLVALNKEKSLESVFFELTSSQEDRTELFEALKMM